MAFPAIAAMVAGEAVTASMVLTTVSSIGAVAGAVGAITGNADLLKIGGVMGLVGGVGGLINGAAGAASGAVESAVTPGVVDGAQMAASDYAAVSPSAWDAAGLGGNVSQGIGEAASANGVVNLPKNIDAMSDWAPGEMTSATSSAAPTAASATQSVAPSVTGAAKPDAGLSIQSPSAGVGQAPTVTPVDGTNALAKATQQASTASTLQNSNDYFSKFMSFVKDNKEIANSAMTLGAGMLNGMNQRSMFDEKMALEKQRLAQTGYGNQVASYKTPGIVQSARGIA